MKYMLKRLVAEKQSQLIALTLSSLIFGACATVPLTGRKQLNLVSEAEVVNMSLTQYDTFLKANKLSANKVETERIRKVGGKIAIAVERYLQEKNLSSYVQGYKWEFNLVEDKAVNAWCMPGGKVVVYTGIMPLIKNDAQLATVMAHEIAHAVARHSSERMSEQLLAQGVGTGLSLALSQKPQETQQLAMLAFGIGAQVGYLLPFSRTHELEADELGLYFMAMAGYDPHQSVEFWKTMSQNNANKMPEFLSTNPMDQNRIDKINAKMEEAMKYYQPKTNKSK